MKLIDADALKERIRHFLGIKSLDYLLPAERAIVEQIDHMPTITPKVSECNELAFRRCGLSWDYCDGRCDNCWKRYTTATNHT